MHVLMKAAFWILPLCLVACGDNGRIITSDQSESSSVSEMSLSSALLIAVINGDLEQMTQLLDQGAEANDAIQVAAAGGNLDVVELLLDRGAVPDELTVLRAVSVTPLYGDKGREVVKLLLQRGAKADWRSLFGAIHFNDPDLVRILLSPVDAAIDINQKNGEGYTAMDEAAQSERWEISQLLREFGGEYANPTED